MSVRRRHDETPAVRRCVAELCTAMSPGTVIASRLKMKSAATLHALQHPPIPLLQKNSSPQPYHSAKTFMHPFAGKYVSFRLFRSSVCGTMVTEEAFPWTTPTMKRRDFLHYSAMTAAAVSVTNLDSIRAAESKPKLQFTAEGQFKIAQFTDTHYRTDKKNVAVESVRLIEETLDAEKPQLVVYTGDIVVAGDTKPGWDNILAPCIDRQIPFAVVLGNHDHENTKLSPREIVDYIAGKPFSVTQSGPEDIFGASNYVLEIYDGEKIANLLYCLDSNAYPKKPIKGRYDWFHDDQIAWYRNQSSAYTKQNDGMPVPALAFFHIPLNEYGEMVHHQAILATERLTEYNAGNIIRTKKDSRTGFDSILIGQRFEIECPGAVNSGMFHAMWSQKDVMGTFVGHDHVNDYIGLYQDIALAFGRWSGTNTTYGSKYMTHGSRLIELVKDGGRTFKTWIRQRGGETFFPVNVPQDLTANKG